MQIFKWALWPLGLMNIDIYHQTQHIISTVDSTFYSLHIPELLAPAVLRWNVSDMRNVRNMSSCHYEE